LMLSSMFTMKSCLKHPTPSKPLTI
jgi:hypothetical protein